MRFYPLLLVLILVISCKSKKKEQTKEPEPTFVSALSILKGQVAHVDTSLYPIMRIEYRDSVTFDTVFIPREEFRAAAKDFLDIPDLDDKAVAARFKEEKVFDETIGRLVLTYTPIDPTKEEVKKEEIIVNPNADSKENISTILIDRSISNRDSSVQKRMLWQMDRYFQVTTIRQYPGKPETVNTFRISWNEDKFE